MFLIHPFIHLFIVIKRIDIINGPLQVHESIENLPWKVCTTCTSLCALYKTFFRDFIGHVTKDTYFVKDTAIRNHRSTEYRGLLTRRIIDRLIKYTALLVGRRKFVVFETAETECDFLIRYISRYAEVTLGFLNATPYFSQRSNVPAGHSPQKDIDLFIPINLYRLANTFTLIRLI